MSVINYTFVVNINCSFHFRIVKLKLVKENNLNFALDLNSFTNDIVKQFGYTKLFNSIY